MKTIGLLGGMSYESTLHYYEGINNQVNEEMGGLVTPELLIDSVNFSEFRNFMLNGDWDKIKIELFLRANFLQRMGADYIAIATNTMHKVAPYIEANLDVPLIHIGDSVSERCIDNGVKKVGLLGTKYTMEEKYMINRLEDNGLEVFVPNSSSSREKIDSIIFDELCKGKMFEESKKYYIKEINKLKDEKDVDAVILGCTEIGMLIKPSDINVLCFDTTACHIDDISNHAMGLRRRIK